MVTILRDNQNRSAIGIHERRASMRQQSANEKAFSIEAVLSTEQPVLMWDWDRWEAVDEILLASGRQVADSVPLLDSHKSETINRVLGHVENIRTEVTDTVGLMLFDGNDPDAVKAFNKYRGNHATDVSVGYVVTAFIEVKPGESTTIEGRTFTAGIRRLRIATAWKLNELSAVARGADSKAKVRGDEKQSASVVQVTAEEAEQFIQRRSANGETPKRIESKTEPTVVININNGDLEKPVERSTGNNSNAGDGNERQVAMTTATTQPETKTGVDENEILKRGVQMERKRQTDIKAIADGVRAETLSKALDDSECTVDKARELFLKDFQEQRSAKPVGSDAPGMIVGNRQRDINEVSLACALAKRMGFNIENVGHRFDYDPITGETLFERSSYKNDEKLKEWHRNLERADKYARNIHSVDLAREALRIAKVEEPIERRALVTRALSTPAISSIYNATVSAILLASLGDMNDSTVGWCNEVEAKNFQDTQLHRVDGGRLKRRNRGQAAAHATLASVMEVLKVKDFAETLIIDRQDIIDDELGVLKSAIDTYSLAIVDLRPSLVYAMLATNAALKTDGVALFHSTHANLFASATPLSAANLEAALAALGSQKNAAGMPLNLANGAYLITGLTYGFTADQLATSAEVRSATGTIGTKNQFLKFGLTAVSDSRISAGFTDPDTEATVAAASTTWYLGSRNGIGGATVGYLAGTNRMPTLGTSILNSKGEYGIAMDLQFPLGVGVAGHQGLVKAVG